QKTKEEQPAWKLKHNRKPVVAVVVAVADKAVLAVVRVLVALVVSVAVRLEQVVPDVVLAAEGDNMRMCGSADMRINSTASHFLLQKFFTID
ncbi:MAG TPA: hypothetical protein VFL47_03495, partial [Flavisolibacter sp.]|nr:hypothetical protein [Flavisolibacter sp.]